MLLLLCPVHIYDDSGSLRRTVFFSQPKLRRLGPPLPVFPLIKEPVQGLSRSPRRVSAFTCAIPARSVIIESPARGYVRNFQVCFESRDSILAAPPCLGPRTTTRSEEHTSELQSRENLVCRLLLEKKK